MALPVINTRDDLDAIAGTPEHDEFVAVLRGTLWRLEKDDEAQAWVAVEDNATIERFGFVRADFPDVAPPEAPPYTPPSAEIVSCSRWQMRKVLNRIGLRQAVEDAVLASPDQELKDGWALANEFRSDDPYVIQMGKAMGKSQSEIVDLIKMASSL